MTSPDTPAQTAAPTPVAAEVYRPHDYHADPDWAPHTEDNAPAPCTCGSAKDAFVHMEEARTSPHTVMALSAGDNGLHSEQALARGGNGSAVVLPGTDTREGTPLATQEPGTVRSGGVDEPVAAQAGDQPAAEPVAKTPAAPAE